MTGKRIRPAGPLDLFALSVVPATALQLDLVLQLLSPYHTLQATLASWLRLREPLCALLYDGGHGLLACAHAHRCPSNPSWEVRYLAVWKEGLESAHTLWEELLLGLGREAGRRGAARLLAYLPSEDHLEPFQRAGFRPFAEEILLLREGKEAAAGAQPTPALRPIRDDDLWAIQQLYLSLTPPRVQQAEGSDSDSWQASQGGEAWVWREADQVQVYLRRRRASRGTVLNLLLDPACRQQAQAVLAYGLVGARPPVYLVLRSYQGELLEVARRLGFRIHAEQVLLGKQLTVALEERPPVAARGAERRFGAAPTTPSVGNH